MYKAGILHKNINGVFVSQSHKDGSVGRSVGILLPRHSKGTRLGFLVQFLSWVLFLIFGGFSGQENGNNLEMGRKILLALCIAGYLSGGNPGDQCTACVVYVDATPTLRFMAKLADHPRDLKFDFVFTQVAKTPKMPIPHPIPLINIFSFYLEPRSDLLLGSAKLHLQAMVWAPRGCWWKRFDGAMGSQSDPEGP